MTEPKRRHGVTEATHKAMAEAFLRRQAEAAERQAAEDAEVEAAYMRAVSQGRPTTVAAIRQALADSRAGDAERMRRDQAEAARIAVGLEAPPDRTTVDDVRRVADTLREPDGSRPTLEVVAAKLGLSERWVSKLCRPDGGYRQVVKNRK